MGRSPFCFQSTGMQWDFYPVRMGEILQSTLDAHPSTSYIVTQYHTHFEINRKGGFQILGLSDFRMGLIGHTCLDRLASIGEVGQECNPSGSLHCGHTDRRISPHQVGDRQVSDFRKAYEDSGNGSFAAVGDFRLSCRSHRTAVRNVHGFVFG